eukprot:CAMPEP_0184725182 /NCGR_PEP_ID=MMETSP0314-20130426/30158_1 /TAXON_ID=38298 /ORGANISM="Rhodella maculata, Strain CCMP 736" /LENGTH=58 /DNA_ID=CAMNT_0027190345 /DNA_START=673 /DNA_END=849 /DNA_ORIENTATION=-
MITILNDAAAADAATVFNPTGKSFVDSSESNNVTIPAFAAVSPNLDSGPCISAGTYPL